MYHMHWTLDEVRALSVPEFQWAVAKLKEQKDAEAKAIKKAGGRKR